MSSHESHESDLTRESLSRSRYSTDEVGVKLARLDERVVSAITDIDGFMDAEVYHEDKVYMEYHLFRVHEMLKDLIDS